MLIFFLACSDADIKDDTAQPIDATKSPGCGLDPVHAIGGTQSTIFVDDVERSFYLSIPMSYDPEQLHRLVFGFSGTDWVGSQIQDYLGLEEYGTNTIFVYPDPLWRTFEGWGTYGGWLLGPHAYPAHGNEDLDFVEELLNTLSAQYCIDEQSVFATGHSWGGDMAQVVSCFLGDRFTATVPVAANRPYWFEDEQGRAISCSGDTAVWTMFGEADDHFTGQSYPGEFGEECRDFWVHERNCSTQSNEFYLGEDLCFSYSDCDAEVRYCLYDEQYAHQIPWDYFSKSTMEWFESFSPQ
ncbi:MAG: hypothetical protein CL916_03725 [Deltaproteobacteria bacterium]|nr:hypothetical protein [Deltaproteobacteria bacterium]